MISAEWIDAEGGLQRADNHKFTLDVGQDYTGFLTLKLMPKGTMLQLLSGKDFDDAQYGRWSVTTYIDGIKIERKEFIFNDP